MPQCAGCGQDVPRSGYSSNQLKKGEARRCSGCVGGGSGEAKPAAAANASAKPAAANASAKPATAVPMNTGTLPCSNCAKEVETSGYSKNQLVKSERRRCKACVEALAGGGGGGGQAASKQRKGGKGKGKGNGKGGGGGKGKGGGRSGKGGGGRGRGQVDDYDSEDDSDYEDLGYEDDMGDDGPSFMAVPVRSRIRPHSMQSLTAFPDSGHLLPADAAIADIVGIGVRCLPAVCLPAVMLASCCVAFAALATRPDRIFSGWVLNTGGHACRTPSSWSSIRCK